MSYSKIRPRRGTLYEWSTYNPILYEGELAVEYPESGVGTGLCRFKIGDGVTKYSNLPYAFDGAAAASINGGSVDSFHLIQLRSGTSQQWEIADPILDVNEIAYDSTQKSLKIGDGVHTWSELSYIRADDSIDPNAHDFGDEDIDDM